MKEYPLLLKAMFHMYKVEWNGLLYSKIVLEFGNRYRIYDTSDASWQ